LAEAPPLAFFEGLSDFLATEADDALFELAFEFEFLDLMTFFLSSTFLDFYWTLALFALDPFSFADFFFSFMVLLGSILPIYFVFLASLFFF